MSQLSIPGSLGTLASRIDAEIRALADHSTPHVRNIRQKYTHQLAEVEAEFVLGVARELLNTFGHRWVSYELIRNHKAAFRSVGESELEELGQGINSWWSVDSFARTLAGPAWLMGYVKDDLIQKWAHSDDS